MSKLFKLYVLAICIAFLCQTPISFAVEKADKTQSVEVVKTDENVQSQEEEGLKEISLLLSEIEKDIKEDNFTRQSLEESQFILSEKELALAVIIRKLEKEQVYAQEALSAFGEENNDETTDNEEIAQMREKYTANLNNCKNRLIEATLLNREIVRIGALISEARSRIFIGNLVAQKNALVVPKTFWRAISDAAVFFWKVAVSPIEWFQTLDENGRSDLYKKGWYVLLILGLGLSLGLFIRSYIIRRWGYKRSETDTPGYGQKVVVAIVTALAYGVIPSLLIGGCLVWEMTNESLIQSKFGKVMAGALYYAFYVTLSCAATRVVLAPWNGRWRLFNISDSRAERVFRAMTWSLILLGSIAYLRHISVHFDATEELTLLLAVCTDAIKAFTIVFVTISIFGEIKNKQETEEEKDAPLVDDEDETMSTGMRVILFACLFALITFSVSIFGYPDLANFIFNRFFASVFMIGMFVVVRTMISDILRRSIIFWIKTFKMRKRLLSKVDFLMTLLITPLLLLFLIFMLLRLWGVPASFMVYGIKKFIFGFKVGGINISLIAILTGLCVFIVSLTLVKMLRRRLSENLLRRINMDEGIKHSLLSGISLTGFVIAVILAMVAMGVDLSNLAVIAGALSVGIGFGLQDVIKNLVSGIIILFERPFKVGDWVILAGEEGKIKQINIRSTELETWTKRSVIIPNATLISSSLVNLTHGDNWQRQSIMVGVSYDSDADKVKELLLECARSNKRVAKVPAPMVLFRDFGASSLDFELRFYVPNVQMDYAVNSDLRYTILRRFREEGINIAYPQLVIHKGCDDIPAETVDAKA